MRLLPTHKHGLDRVDARVTIHPQVTGQVVVITLSRDNLFFIPTGKKKRSRDQHQSLGYAIRHRQAVHGVVPLFGKCGQAFDRLRNANTDREWETREGMRVAVSAGEAEIRLADDAAAASGEGH